MALRTPPAVLMPFGGPPCRCRPPPSEHCPFDWCRLLGATLSPSTMLPCTLPSSLKRRIDTATRYHTAAPLRHPARHTSIPPVHKLVLTASPFFPTVYPPAAWLGAVSAPSVLAFHLCPIAFARLFAGLWWPLPEREFFASYSQPPFL